MASDSLKRLLTLIVTAGIALAKPVLEAHGVPVPSDNVMDWLVAAAMTFITGSNAKSIVEAHAAGKVEAAKITTVAQADAAIAEAIK